MTKGRRPRPLSCFSCPDLGFALWVVLVLFLLCGHPACIHAQWLAPYLLYSPQGLQSSSLLSSLSPSVTSSSSSFTNWDLSQDLSQGAGLFLWPGFSPFASYPQASLAASPGPLAGWQGLLSYNSWGNPLASLAASLTWANPWSIFSPPFTAYGLTAYGYGMALPLLQNALGTSWLNPLAASLLLGAASNSSFAASNALLPGTATPLPFAASIAPPVDRRTVGIETGGILYKLPARQSAGMIYVPGVPAYTANQVIVTFKPGTPSLEVGRVCASNGFREAYTSPYGGYTVLNTTGSVTALQAARRLRAESSVLFAEPNYLRRAHFIPNDPYYKYQWHLPRLNCSYAWDFAQGAGTLVALLDSGVAFETNATFTQAPDLAGTLFAPGYDFVNNDPYPDDDYGHGTHMAGCIAQTTNNLTGTAGVAFNATIMPVKIMDNLGGVVISTEVDGIYFAVNSGAKVISMSLGGPGTSATEAAAITYAYNNGVTIICSAGNAGSSTPEYPASYAEPVSVSAIRYDYSIPSYSNYGQYVDVCAPGGDLSVDQNVDGFGDGILQQTHDGKNYSSFYYYFMEGTSPACALVSGVAALIIGKSTVPLTAANVAAILKGSATDLGTTGWDQYYGYGLVNAYLAVLQTP
ncbi:MAG: S8 family peptidase [bacterium]